MNHHSIEVAGRPGPRGVPPRPDDPVAGARADERVGQLAQAAAALMARQGYHGTSMQDVAADAGVSVGLIYRYFENKEALLAHVVTGIMGGYLRRLPPAMAGFDDPVLRLRAGFAAYCEVIDEHRPGALLAYREGKSMPAGVLDRVKELELETTELLADPARDAVAAGIMRERVDPFLLAYDLSIFGHMWALKHWYLTDRITLAAYIDQQFALCMSGAIDAEHELGYRHVMSPSAIGGNA